MSVEQYQRTVNSLDKDIADLEKKKAALDKKVAEERRKAANITISKNAAATTVRSKFRQQENHLTAANKAVGESASIAQKIAEKRKKRNDAAVHLQKEEIKTQKKHDKATKQILQSYEQRIENLQRHSAPTSPHQAKQRKLICPHMMCSFLMHGKTRRNSWTNLSTNFANWVSKCGMIPAKSNGAIR